MKFGIYHKGCTDGTMSAAMLKRAIPRVILFPTSHAWEWKTDMTLKEGDEIYFVDICPLPEDLVELNDKKIKYTIIDHHKTSDGNIKKYLGEHPDTKIENYNYYPEKCGTTAVWDFFFKDKKPPELLKFIEIGDLWKWDRDENSKFISQYIFFKLKRDSPESAEEMIKDFDYKEYTEKGKLIYEYMMNEIEHTAKKAEYLDFKGDKVLSVNSDYASSDVGNYLAKQSENKLGLSYTFYPELNLVKFSIRGLEGDGARRIAQKFGGGGHDKASGFRMTIDEFYEIIKNARDTYSGRRNVKEKN